MNSKIKIKEKEDSWNSTWKAKRKLKKNQITVCVSMQKIKNTKIMQRLDNTPLIKVHVNTVFVTAQLRS